MSNAIIRRSLPVDAKSLTHKFRVGGQKGYIIVSLFEDDTPGEIFISIAKEGSTLSGMVKSFCLLFSAALQYGMPLQDICKKLKHMRFEPDGQTSTPEIPFADSIIDYIAKWMELRFVDKV